MVGSVLPVPTSTPSRASCTGLSSTLGVPSVDMDTHFVGSHFVGSHFVRPQLRTTESCILETDEFYIISGVGLSPFVPDLASGMDNGRVSGMYSDRRFGGVNSRPCSLRMAIWVIGMRVAWLNELSDSIRDFIRAAERLELAGTHFIRPGCGLRRADLVDLDEPMLI